MKWDGVGELKTEARGEDRKERHISKSVWEGKTGIFKDDATKDRFCLAPILHTYAKHYLLSI